MGICKETALIRQLFMILFAFYLPVDINNNTLSASGCMIEHKKRTSWIYSFIRIVNADNNTWTIYLEMDYFLVSMQKGN
jgi:hypothetical protein